MASLVMLLCDLQPPGDRPSVAIKCHPGAQFLA
jgi:hypothetical protein